MALFLGDSGNPRNNIAVGGTAGVPRTLTGAAAAQSSPLDPLPPPPNPNENPPAEGTIPFPLKPDTGAGGIDDKFG